MSSNILRRWLRRQGIYTGKITRTAFYAEHSDLPEIPKANELAIAGSPTNPKWAALDCPCGKGHTILLPLSRSEDPHWSVSKNVKHQPSLYPSIDRNRYEGVRCHFWLKDGRIHWVKSE